MKKVMCLMIAILFCLMTTTVTAVEPRVATLQCRVCGAVAKLINVRPATDDECDYRLVYVWHEEMQHNDVYEGISYIETWKCQTANCGYEWNDRYERLVLFSCGDEG